MPTTYHYWAKSLEIRRGPGYLRRWIAGETVGGHVRRLGAEDIPYVLQVLRGAGAALAYLHDGGNVHGAISPEVVWVNPMGRLWVLGWQWAVPRTDIPAGLEPSREWMPIPAEWRGGGWEPTVLSDQWQLAAACFLALTGEEPPEDGTPPVRWLRPECPQGLAEVLDRALMPDPNARHRSIGSMLRALDRGVGTRTTIVVGDERMAPGPQESAEARLRWAVADEYDVLAALGAGSFGSVWRVRDLSLEREVALKMLHPNIAADASAVTSFRREARLAAQLAHPAIVPIYDWDNRGDVSWYTMELAEGGSVADLVSRAGPRSLPEIASQIDAVLDALTAAHTAGVIHRDLKPENILIDRYRRWRLTDFGIANIPGVDIAGPTGTPAFAAPEQLLGEAQGSAVDCFAMAAIVFFLLTGAPPFGERDAKAILARQLSGGADLTQFPGPLEDWLREGLSPQADDRFADAAAMQRAWRDTIDLLQTGSRDGAWWRRWWSVATTRRASGGFDSGRG